MSVYDRVGDSLFLWQHDRFEGALLSILVAASATARKRYPRLGDGEAFEKFLVDAHPVRLSIEYRGAQVPIERLFWKWLRCEMIHQGALPLDIQFMGKDTAGQMFARAGGAPAYQVRLGHGWFHHVVTAVVQAPENADLLLPDPMKRK